MKKFNLSAWALAHPQFIVFLMLFVMLTGVQSYFKLGRSEEPSFTLKVMVVQTLWPGATAKEVEQQITERVEKKLQTVPWMDYLSSYSKPGESLIFIVLKESLPQTRANEIFRLVRNKVDDVRPELPAGALGPFPNDEFGDVYINLFALTGDGVSLGELRREADRFARELRRVPDVKKVDLFGVQQQKIYVDISPSRLARLGISTGDLVAVLQQQNMVQPQGFVETDTDRLQLRVTGAYDTVAQVRDTALAVAGRKFRLGDVAEVSAGYSDPPDPMIRVGGKDAIAVAVSMEKGGDVLALGRRVHETMASIKADTPRGVDFSVIVDQPSNVKVGVGLFMRSFAEAVAIVLAVSFLSLGWRTGLVVALSVPLVLAATFLAMRLYGIDLHLTSLGALIIALGLLVDDAIIAVEMMVVKIEQGWDKAKAATFAYTSTAMPMLFGTLITAAAFMPAGLAKSSSSEYASSIFWVVAGALLISWFVAVLFTPYIGYRLLDVDKLRASIKDHSNDVYDTPFYNRLRRVVEWCLQHRWRVIAATAAAFAASVVLMSTVVQKQFFPDADHLEVMVNLWLPEGASLQATKAMSLKLEETLAADPAVASFTGYIGSGAPRFQLSQNMQLQNNNFAEYTAVAKNSKARGELIKRLREHFADPAGPFAGARARANIFRFGPPVDFPVAFRLSGPDIPTLQHYGEMIAAEMRRSPHLGSVHLHGAQPSKRMQIKVDYDKAAALGVSRQQVALTLQAAENGIPVTQVRDGDELIDVVVRGGKEAQPMSQLPDLMIAGTRGRSIPLSQVATLEPTMEDGVIWRRNRLPTITIQSDVIDGRQPPTLTEELLPKLKPIIDQLPPGVHFEVAGLAEESARGSDPIFDLVPWVGLLITTLLMIQLQSFSRTALVLLTAPLGMIGVALLLVLTNTPFGFVANLGVIALSGMIMRNSVILVDQIDQDTAAGKSLWNAIIDSTVRRFRPIVLTAAASMLAMIPLARETFWGPMAIAIMGGLLVATLLTCLFLPALYAAWYRVKPGAPDTITTPNELTMEGVPQ